MVNSIEVRNVEKFYKGADGRKKVLNGLNMTVKSGSILIGASGCGKTTLLACILGIRKVDKGTIDIMGHRIEYGKELKIPHLIGYMPQDTALVSELTIRENLKYFGNIFQMNESVFEERYKMIMELLELKSENYKILNLSGGQKRRVSMAASFIHNPLILILDEPTVGLDSLLREKIWNFLLNITKTSKISIIITTHYITEAENSDRCGLMRNGVLLAENCPRAIVSLSGAVNLDEAFLNLCLLKEHCSIDQKDAKKLQYLTELEDHVDIFKEENVESYKYFEKRKKFSWQTIGALLMKEYIRMKRQPVEYFFILIFPILQIFAVGYAVGGYPIGLKLGVINNELKNHSSCLEYLLQNTSYTNENGECVFNEKASCHFINEINDNEIAIKVFYDSYSDAFRDAKAGKIIGFIVLSESFTQDMLHPHDILPNENSIIKEAILVQLDESNLQISTFLHFRLYQAYLRFNKKLYRGCGINEKEADIPMNFNETLFGSLDKNFKDSIYAVWMLQVIFFTLTGYSSFSISQFKLEGVWNRTLLAGVKCNEIFFATMIMSIVITTIILFEIFVVSIMILDITMIGQYYLLLFMGLLICTSAITLGILVSSTSENFNTIIFVLLGFSQVATTISGVTWPIEGQPKVLKYLSYVFPITIPSLSIKNIMIKGLGLTNPSVYSGCIVLSVWTIIATFLTVYILNKKKISDS